ncbi:MAG: hypothetical protein LQ347_000665 [Umbilicaria vellea]|nr:MAG: hypothetical protein LQ347_000665 [Umbilicaria vellea]
MRVEKLRDDAVIAGHICPSLAEHSRNSNAKLRDYRNWPNISPLPKMPLPMPSSTESPSNSETAVKPNSAVNQAASSASHTAASPAAPSAQQAKSEAEKAADKLYEERMEDEYAKREGGA